MRVSNTRLPTILACGVCLAVVAISTSPVDAGSSSSGNTYALVLSGISKDAQERQIKDKAVANLRDFLLREAQVKPNRLAVLVADNSLVRNPTATSSAESLTRAIGTFAQAVQPADRFLFYYVGQANVVAGTLRLNLPGPDAAHEQLGKWLGAIRATSMLVVLDCPGAAVACKAVAGPNRVVICAATEGQLSSTRFSEYFVPALTDSAGDRDDDGRISILEAFTASARQISEWYREQQLLPTETPTLEDDGDAAPSERPWRFKADGTDGLIASTFFLTVRKRD